MWLALSVAAAPTPTNVFPKFRPSIIARNAFGAWSNPGHKSSLYFIREWVRRADGDELLLLQALDASIEVASAEAKIRAELGFTPAQIQALVDEGVTHRGRPAN